MMKTVLLFLSFLFSSIILHAQLTASPDTVNFGSAGVSVVDSVTITGTSLTPPSDTLRVTAPTNFAVSFSGSSWSGSLSLVYTGGTIPATKIYVRFNPPGSTGVYSGMLLFNNSTGYLDTVFLTGRSIPLCSSTITGGSVTPALTICDSCTVTLYDTTYTPRRSGLDLQWQLSTDSLSWTNISGATNETFTISTAATRFYRMIVACPFSGVLAYSGIGLFVHPVRIISHSALLSSTDTSCAGPLFTVVPDTYDTMLSLRTAYGDGSYDSFGISSIYPGYSFRHAYAASGTYTISYVLFDRGIPVDTASDTVTYSFCRTSRIRVFFDGVVPNCVKDTGENWITSPITVYVDSNGTRVDTVHTLGSIYYRANMPAGTIVTYRLLPTPGGYGHYTPVCYSGGVLTDTILSGTAFNRGFDVGATCDSSTEHAVFNTVRYKPTTGLGTLYVFNHGCLDDSVMATLDVSPRYYFSAITDSTGGRTTHGGTSNLIWNVPTPAQGVQSLSYQLDSRSWHAPGDTVASLASVTPISPMEDSTDNYQYRADTIRSSWDPNYVEPNPAGCGIVSGQTIEYTVGFENMGNDTAHNIYVMDTLSDNLDAATLAPLFASHYMEMEPYVAGGHHIVKFGFPNIMLPDSSHHNLCQGVFRYKIRVKNGLTSGTLIYARVGIYFDANPVVMTNTAVNRIGCPIVESVHQQSVAALLIYPNPAHSILNVEVQDGAWETATLSNTLGSNLTTVQLKGSLNQINVSYLPAGVYYLTLRGTGGVKVSKFVKQ